MLNSFSLCHCLQATVETVLKVSHKQVDEEEDDADDTTAASNTTSSLLPGNKSKTPAKNDTALSPAGSKPKSKPKKQENVAEKEVDRIIDSQDNEYILSRPK